MLPSCLGDTTDLSSNLFGYCSNYFNNNCNPCVNVAEATTTPQSASVAHTAFSCVDIYKRAGRAKQSHQALSGLEYGSRLHHHSESKWDKYDSNFVC